MGLRRHDAVPVTSRQSTPGHIWRIFRFFCFWVPEGSLAKNFRAGCPRFYAEPRPRDTPRSPGLARNINLHQRSAPETNSKAKWSRTEDPARLPSGTQCLNISIYLYLYIYIYIYIPLSLFVGYVL